MSNYLQTTENVKTDLKFKLIETKEIGTITVKDSLEHFKFHRGVWKEKHEEMAKKVLEGYQAMKQEYWDLKDERERLQKMLTMHRPNMIVILMIRLNIRMLMKELLNILLCLQIKC